MHSEQDRIQTLADEVGKTLGLPSYPVYMVDIDPFDPIPNMGFNVMDRIFEATHGIYEALGPDLLRGVIAHEYGHSVETFNPFAMLFFTDEQRRAIESRADRFAALHGFGRELMDANKMVLTQDPSQDDEVQTTHPRMSTRQRHLEQWTAQYEAKHKGDN